MGIEKDCLKKAFASLPDASNTTDQTMKASYLISIAMMRDLVYYDADFGDVDDYVEIKVEFTFDKDPMATAQKGWRHTSTLIWKRPFIRGY